MTHSTEPSGFLGDRPAAGAVWHWRLLDPTGAEVSPEDAGLGRGPRFTAQGDAESWLGESWKELADEGVDAVTLLEGDREVYGPMSLKAE